MLPGKQILPVSQEGALQEMCTSSLWLPHSDPPPVRVPPSALRQVTCQTAH